MGGLVAIVKNILIVVCIIAAIAGILLLVFDGNPSVQKKLKAVNGKDAKGGKKSKSQKKEKQNEEEKIKFKNSQDLLDFDTIEQFSKENPIGLIVRNEKTEFIGGIQVEGINFNLLSMEEKEMLELLFSRLLNGIDYPIQIMIQSRRLDIEDYMYRYQQNVDEIKNRRDKLSEKMKHLKSMGEAPYKITILEDELNSISNQYEYGENLLAYIRGRCSDKAMLQKKYYVLFKYNHKKMVYNEELNYDEILRNAFYDISNKAGGIKSALSRAKIKSHILTSLELAELVYTSYNKQDSEVLSFKKAISSRFSHLAATTLEDIEEKIEITKAEKKLKELEHEEQLLSITD